MSSLSLCVFFAAHVKQANSIHYLTLWPWQFKKVDLTKTSTHVLPLAQYPSVRQHWTLCQQMQYSCCILRVEGHEFVHAKLLSVQTSHWSITPLIS